MGFLSKLAFALFICVFEANGSLDSWQGLEELCHHARPGPHEEATAETCRSLCRMVAHSCEGTLFTTVCLSRKMRHENGPLCHVLYSEERDVCAEFAPTQRELFRVSEVLLAHPKRAADASIRAEKQIAAKSERAADLAEGGDLDEPFGEWEREEGIDGIWDGSRAPEGAAGAEMKYLPEGSGGGASVDDEVAGQLLGILEELRGPAAAAAELHHGQKMQPPVKLPQHLSQQKERPVEKSLGKGQQKERPVEKSLGKDEASVQPFLQDDEMPRPKGAGKKGKGKSKKVPTVDPNLSCRDACETAIADIRFLKNNDKKMLKFMEESRCSWTRGNSNV